jgi:hypothetical protein
MTRDTANVLVGEGRRDSLKASVRGHIRGFIEALMEEELTAALGARALCACARPRALIARSEAAGG